MFFIYLFIFWKNKYISTKNNILPDTYSEYKVVVNSNGIIFINNNSNYSYELNCKKTILNSSGHDTRYNETTILVNDFLTQFTCNQKKKQILHDLLSVNHCIHYKLQLTENLDDFKNKSKLTPSLFSGGFFKDSDFYF